MNWNTICTIEDILSNSGVCALINGQQVAIFRVQTPEGEMFYGLDNYDPFSHANVISRGLVGSLGGKIVVASPIYKQHFELATGQCLEDEEVRLNTWQVQNDNGSIQVLAKDAVAA
jgi:nitrite reductase (NADH) small subunit